MQISAHEETTDYTSYNEQFLTESLSHNHSIIQEEEIDLFLDASIPFPTLFTKKEFLGRGIHASVYRITDSKEYSYAVKEFPIEPKRFLLEKKIHEFQVGLELNHPNILTIHHLVIKPSEWPTFPQVYLLMEYIEGASLLRTETLTHSKKLLLEFLSAYRHILSKGLIPFDLHSNNLMITSNQQIKFINLAVFFHPMTNQSTTPS